jgi:hypothetical protein
MVDCSTKRLAAMCYTEDIGKKGGNNVASLIWHNLKRLDIVGTLEPFKELNIVMDNCGGQNKNRMVLRMLFYLVKKGVAIDARLVFLVRGHTKNDCDRLFNLMKRLYRKSNVYTPSDLQDCIQHEMIDTLWINDATTFKDWDAQQDDFITRPTDINTRHIFLVSATRNNGITMYMESYNTCGDVVARNLVKPAAVLDANYWLNLQDPTPVDPVAILDIKWMELYDKWKKFVPEESIAKWRYYNEDPGQERRDKVKRNRKKTKATRKARTTDAPVVPKRRRTTNDEGPQHPGNVI